MKEPAEGEVSRILRTLAGNEGDPGEATDRLFEAAFAELHRIAAALMRQERSGHTLQTTAIVNEAYLRLMGDAPVEWQSRAHFFGIVASAMRRVLVEHARRRGAARRGGGWTRVAFQEDQRTDERSPGDGAGPGKALNPPGQVPGIDILDLDRTLFRFAEIDPRAARVVELRVFGGLTAAETARILGVSERTVQGDWRVAVMWLRRELSEERGP